MQRHCPQIITISLLFYVFVTWVTFQQIVHDLQKQCFKVTTKVNLELERWFPMQDVMHVLGLVIYSQYWLKLMCDETFCVHLVVLKMFYYKPRKLGSSKTWIPTIVDDHILDSQQNLMPNGLWINSWIWTPCPSFGKSCPIMLCCLLILVSSWKWQNWWWFILWDLWKTFFFFAQS